VVVVDKDDSLCIMASLSSRPDMPLTRLSRFLRSIQVNRGGGVREVRKDDGK
jgi:hypothetical protein